jgi:hypothetical protein
MKKGRVFVEGRCLDLDTWDNGLNGAYVKALTTTIADTSSTTSSHCGQPRLNHVPADKGP